MMSCRLSGVPAIPFLGPLRRPGYCLGGCLDRHEDPIPKLPYLFSCLNISASTCKKKSCIGTNVLYLPCCNGPCKILSLGCYAQKIKEKKII